MRGAVRALRRLAGSVVSARFRIGGKGRMRVAVISDIHSNYKALEAFLAYIEDCRVDAVIGLGDYVTDCPYPERTLSLLHEMEKKYPCHLLRATGKNICWITADRTRAGISVRPTGRCTIPIGICPGRIWTGWRPCRRRLCCSWGIARR